MFDIYKWLLVFAILLTLCVLIFAKIKKKNMIYNLAMLLFLSLVFLNTFLESANVFTNYNYFCFEGEVRSNLIDVKFYSFMRIAHVVAYYLILSTVLECLLKKNK